MPSATELIQMSLIGEALEHGPALIFIADDQMKYVAVNQLVADTLGYTREELLGMHVTDVVRTETAPAEYHEMIVRRERSGYAVLTCKDGRELGCRYEAREAKIAQLSFFVSVGFLDDPR